MPLSKESFMSVLGLLYKHRAPDVCQQRTNIHQIHELHDTISDSTGADHPASNWCELGGGSHAVNSCLSSKDCPFAVLLDNNFSRSSKESSSLHTYRKVCDTFKEYISIMNEKSLHRLDLSSPLCQFVVGKCLDTIGMGVYSDVDTRCLLATSTRSTSIICLRERRQVYPITFKGWLGKHNCTHVHQYKFTRKQKEEFMSKVNTGLDKRSRILLKKMRPCRVKLIHVTNTDLKRWMCAKEIRVILTPLSIEEILYWTNPKTKITSDLPELCLDWLAASASHDNSCHQNSLSCIPHTTRHDLENIPMAGQVFFWDGNKWKNYLRTQQPKTVAHHTPRFLRE